MHDVTAKVGEQEVEHPITDTDQPSIFVFKTLADAFAGRVSYFKVMSGVLKTDDHLINMRTGTDERLAHVARQPFSFFDGFARNFGLMANYTYVDSKIDYLGVVGGVTTVVRPDEARTKK